MRFGRASVVGGAAVLVAIPVAFLSRWAARYLLEHQLDLWPVVHTMTRTTSFWIMDLGAGLLAALIPRADLGAQQSPAMRAVAHVIDRVGPTEASVILLGESGVGKEVAARAIHEVSPRRRGPFVKVNCAAIPAELLESEFFGHEKGAFTEAVARRAGYFERAHEGTLFLDEVAELPLGLQAKLLHVLQDGEVYRLGATTPIRTDVRIVAATNRDLAAAVQTGEFRDDLYYRLDVVEIRIPSLRDRPEEIAPLAEHFRQCCEREYGRAVTIGPATLELFRRYPWPGNVRELETMVRRIAVFGTETSVQGELRAKLEVPPADGEPLDLKAIGRDAARSAERVAILAVLERLHWNRTQAARTLGISYRALLYKIADFGLTRLEDLGADGAEPERDGAPASDGTGDGTPAA